MEFVELLDKIDATAPKACETCLYMATHEKCDDCLHTEADNVVRRTNMRRSIELRKANRYADADAIKDPPYRYANHVPGNWLRRMQEWEREGKRNIVIGGQGEAEVNTKWTPSETSASLHRVSEQCGYVTGSLHKSDDRTRLSIYTTEGHFELRWTLDGTLEAIDRLTEDGATRVQSWPNY